MKGMLVVATLLWLASSADAQISPVSLDVKIASKKKDTAAGLANTSSYSQSRALTITVHNASTQPVNGLVARWGVAVYSDAIITVGSVRKPHTIAYGAEETLDLRPNETRVIETAAVEAEGQRGFSTNFGEKILGHGVQLLIAGKVATENFTPPNLKPYFEKLQPIPGTDKEENASENDRKRGASKVTITRKSFRRAMDQPPLSSVFDRTRR